MSALEPTEAESRAWKRDVDRRNRADLRQRRKREQALERRWHCVYFLYDAKDRLLYVGISANGPARLNGHETSQPWWRKVARAEFEHVKTRTAALDRELEAIQTLKPIWNVARRSTHTESTLSRCDHCGQDGASLWPTNVIHCCFCGWEKPAAP